MDFHSAYILKENGEQIKFKVILWKDANEATIPILYEYTCDNCGNTVQLSGIGTRILSRTDTLLTEAQRLRLLEAIINRLGSSDLSLRRVRSDLLMKRFASDGKALCDDCRPKLVDSALLDRLRAVDTQFNYNQTPNQDDTEAKTDSPELTKSPPYGVEVTVIINPDGTLRDATVEDMK